MSENRLQLIGTDKHVYYGKCKSPESEKDKVVTIINPTGYIVEDEIKESQDSEENITNNEEDGEAPITTTETSKIYLDLSEGDQLLVTFDYGNTVEDPNINLRIVDESRNIDVTDAYGRIILMSNIEYDCKYMWEAGDVVPFIYTDYKGIKYWKFAAVSPASPDKFGTVKIADKKEDLRNDNSKTAITYNLLNEEINDKLDELGLDVVEPSENENCWVDINLTRPENGSDKILDTISLPQLPQRTSELINDGSSPEDTKVYLESEESIYFPYGKSPADPTEQGLPQIGTGYIDKDNNEILNYIPSYNGNLYIGESTQPTIIDGKGVRINKGTDNIYIGNENDEYVSFGPEKNFPNGRTTFLKPVNINNTLYVNDIVGGNFTGGNVNCTNLSTETLKIKENGKEKDIVEFISDNAPPTAVDAQFINWKEDPQQESAPTANFVVKRVWTSKLTGAANSHYLPVSGNNHNDTSSGSHIVCPIPTLEGYTPVGIVGVNVDAGTQGSNGDWASHTRIWECFLGFSESGVTNTAHLAAMNTRDKQQSIYLGIDVLYIQNGNWQVDLTPNPATD